MCSCFRFGLNTQHEKHPVFRHGSTPRFLRTKRCQSTDTSPLFKIFALSWDVVVGSCTVPVLCCGAWSVSYPQPPHRREYGCTVGIDRDPPVRCSHPSKLMRTPERQLLRAWLVLACRTTHVDTSVGRAVVVQCCLTSAREDKNVAAPAFVGDNSQPWAIASRRAPSEAHRARTKIFDRDPPAERVRR